MGDAALMMKHYLPILNFQDALKSSTINASTAPMDTDVLMGHASRVLDNASNMNKMELARPAMNNTHSSLASAVITYYLVVAQNWVTTAVLNVSLLLRSKTTAAVSKIVKVTMIMDVTHVSVDTMSLKAIHAIKWIMAVLNITARPAHNVYLTTDFTEEIVSFRVV